MTAVPETSELFDSILSLHTRLASPPLCPEIRTRESHDVIRVWEFVEERTGRQVEPPFWVCSWPGGQALARYLLDHSTEVRGRVVLDLGCGNGLGAVASAMAGAARTIAADIDPLALRMAEATARLNDVTFESVDTDLLSEPPEVPPLSWILVGDMFYERRLAEAVIPWLRKAGESGATVWIADPGRAYLPDSGLEPVATYDVPVSPDIESVRMRTTRVYRLE